MEIDNKHSDGGVVLKKNKYEIDMCNGSIMNKLISFSLPLMLSGILQLMFNAVDIIVVGQFTGSEALAAVGSTTALIAVFTNLFIGISLGANVLAARFYAAGKHKEMSDTVHTSITLALISGIVMAFAGLLFSRLALEIMATPDNVIDQFLFIIIITFRNQNIFRSIGNTTIQCNITCMSSHYLYNTAPLMRSRGITNFIDSFHCRIDCCIKSDGILGTCNIQINGTRNTNGIYP